MWGTRAARATSWDAPAMAEPKPAAASSAPGDPGVGPDAVSAALSHADETPPTSLNLDAFVQMLKGDIDQEEVTYEWMRRGHDSFHMYNGCAPACTCAARLPRLRGEP